jgi:ubiquitin-activating enzyme E1
MFSREQLHSLNNTCRATHTAFINTSQTGLFGSCFNDFGQNFSVIDKNGEEAEEIMISSIELNDKGKVVVKVLGEQRHKFEDTDVIHFKEVNGMVNSEGKSINDISQIKIRVINPKSFELLDFDIQKYSKYESGGIAK